MPACWKCGGEGSVIVCVDDMCRACGDCIHGDGEDVCNVCFGEGEVPGDDYDYEDETP
jgi:hypothetical protein